MSKQRISLRKFEKDLREKSATQHNDELGSQDKDAKPKKGLTFSSMSPVTLKKQNVSIKTKKVEKPAVKDSISFKSDEEYEEYFLQYVEVHGLNKELYQHIKVFYMSSKNIGGLRKVWKHLEEIGLDECEALLESADVLRQMDEMDLAFEFLDRAVQKFPDSIQAISSVALYYKLTRDYELAIHWLQKWQKLEPTNADALYHLGAVYRRVHSIDLALTSLRNCLQLDSNHLRARALLDKIEK